jgi:hypothetical protein
MPQSTLNYMGPASFTDPAAAGEVPVPGFPEVTEVEEVSPRRGMWPRMLVLDEETENRLVMWLDDEIRKCLSERDGLIEDWERWQRDYWAVPETKIKNFPFERAANIVVPLTAIAVEAVFARLINTVFSVKPLWSIRPRSLSWADDAPVVEKWLQSEVENENSLDMYRFASHALMEYVKLGTSVGKTGYERELRKSIRQGPDGEEPFWVEVKNGPVVDYVPLANFLIRMAEHDPQQASWVGEEHEFSWTQLKRMSQSGRMDSKAIEKIRAYWQTSRDSAMGSSAGYHEKLDEHQSTEPIWNERFDVTEVWASFDVDGDGTDEEIVIDFHRPSRTILSIRYNWYADLRRPYRHGVFIPVEGRFYGLGIGKQNEQFQEEMTTIHRQRLDNATLANMRMIKVRRGLGYSADEPIFPGKMWFVNDHRDVEPIQMSEVYPSSYANEESILRHSERRTGVNEVLLGQPHSGTPGTATDMMTRLAEGTKKYDMVLRNVRRWWGLIGSDVLSGFQQFGTQNRHFFLFEEKGEKVERILRMPQELVVHGAAIELTVTDSTTNRQVEQQQWMGLFRLVTEYYRSVIELSQILQNPQITARLAERALSASDFAAKRLFESFNIVDYEPLLLLEEEMNGGMNGDAAVAGSAGGLGGPVPTTGMEGVQGLLGPAGGSNAPLPSGSPLNGGSLA